MQKESAKKLAKERIEKLFSEAEKDKKKANRYVELARKIAMKSRIPIPRNLKRKFCRHCYSYFNSKNSRVRTRDGKVIYYCLKCKEYTRYPFVKERLIKKKSKK